MRPSATLCDSVHKYRSDPGPAGSSRFASELSRTSACLVLGDKETTF